MKRQIIFFILSLLSCDTLLAYDAEVDGICYNFSGDEAIVTNWPSSYADTYSGSIVIPESVTYEGKEYRVTSIGSEAFMGCSGLTSVTIPNSVTCIGYAALKDCSSLSVINIGSNVTRVSLDAFSGTPWYNNLPDGMVYVGRVAYKYKGEMPVGTHYSIKDGTTSISEQAFAICSGLVSVTIPEGVTGIEELAFGGCSNLISVKLPASLTNIGSGVFYGCSSLRSIEIPNGITTIGDRAFARCSSLTSIAIPEGIREIYNSAFSGCSTLVSVILPKSLINIEQWAFLNCSSLNTIVCYAKRPPFCGEYVFPNVNKQNCKLYVPQGCEEAYRTSNPWKDFENIVALEETVSYTKDQMATIILPTEPDASKGKYYRLDRCEDGKIIFTEEAQPKAQTPYIIVPSEDFSIDLSTLDLEGLTQASVSVGGVSFIGSYSCAEYNCEEGYYIDIIDKTPDCHVDDANLRKATIGALRAYLRVNWDDPYGQGPTKGIRDKLEIVLEDNPNSIAEVKNESEKYDDAIYDLSGRRLSGKPAKGLYIQNGKKIMVK